MVDFDDIEIPDGVDCSKANRLIKRILELEDENDKTKKYSDRDMIQKIGKEIQGDIKCI